MASPTDSLILSASRDMTAITWTRPTAETAFAQGSVLRAGSRYINAVAYIPPSPDAPEGEISHDLEADGECRLLRGWVKAMS